MNFISIFIGLLCFIVMSIGLIPFFGILQWPVMVASVLGIFFGAMAKDNKAGLYLNVAVLAVAIIRTMAGGGAV